MNTVEHLEKARSLVENGWCQGFLARDAERNVVSLRSSEATSFCLVGALKKVNSTLTYVKTVETLQDLIGHWSLALFNDRSSKEEVLELLDRAILQEKGK